MVSKTATQANAMWQFTAESSGTGRISVLMREKQARALALDSRRGSANGFLSEFSFEQSTFRMCDFKMIAKMIARTVGILNTGFIMRATINLRTPTRESRCGGLDRSLNKIAQTYRGIARTSRTAPDTGKIYYGSYQRIP
eukprot:COSAG02_NODE_1440_length_12590_cov_2.822352_5_plen_140_part_00